MELADLDYALPEELIAQQPAAERTAARLLVLSRAGAATQHRTVRDLGELLSPGDLLVLNDTRVIPARIYGRRPSGGRLELLLVQPVGDLEWEVVVRGAPRVGERVHLADGIGEFTASLGEGRWHVRLSLGEPVLRWLERCGEVPLPPYIRRAGSPDAADGARYQTVFAREPGAVAAPTAGLHFTHDLLARLEAVGVRRATLTLHVGPGTFLPIRGGSLEDFVMLPERYEIPVDTVRAIREVADAGGRVVAVGTTTTRALESAALEGPLVPGPGSAAVFIRPGHRFRVVDAMLTNFHLPRSPLLALVAAFAGWERLRAAYEEAVGRRYRFYSFGDAMLIT